MCTCSMWSYDILNSVGKKECLKILLVIFYAESLSKSGNTLGWFIDVSKMLGVIKIERERERLKCKICSLKSKEYGIMDGLK